MARFDIYPNPDAARAADVPYLLDVQCDLLAALDSRVVIPLRRVDRFSAVACFMETPKLAAVPGRILKTPVASLAQSSAAIVGALDFLFQGF